MSTTAGGSILMKSAPVVHECEMSEPELRRERTTLELEMKEAKQRVRHPEPPSKPCTQEVGQQLAILHGLHTTRARHGRPNCAALTSSGSVENAVRGPRRGRCDMRTVRTAWLERRVVTPA